VNFRLKDDLRVKLTAYEYEGEIMKEEALTLFT